MINKIKNIEKEIYEVRNNFLNTYELVINHFEKIEQLTDTEIDKTNIENIKDKIFAKLNDLEEINIKLFNESEPTIKQLKEKVNEYNNTLRFYS